MNLPQFYSADDGGADVILFEENLVGVTDRSGPEGHLYIYSYAFEE